MKDNTALLLGFIAFLVFLSYLLTLRFDADSQSETITRLRQDSAQCHKAILEINTAISLANKDTTFKIK